MSGNSQTTVPVAVRERGRRFKREMQGPDCVLNSALSVEKDFVCAISYAPALACAWLSRDVQ
jgi:hypothetical protein